MAVTNKSVIVRGKTPEVWEEGYFVHTSDSGEVIYPGHLVYQYSGGLTIGDLPTALPTYRVNADVNYPPQIVFENDLIGETINDKIVSGDLIRVLYLEVGGRYVVYGQPATVVAIGTLMSPHTDGTVIANAGPGAGDSTVFRAETAVASTDTDTRLVVRCLRV